jgi:hypothetical protein
MTRLGVALGARAETFMGLSGLGDLVLTATGDLSRNRRVGLLLAEGARCRQAVDSLGHVAEGVYSARTVVERARRLGVRDADRGGGGGPAGRALRRPGRGEPSWAATRRRKYSCGYLGSFPACAGRGGASLRVPTTTEIPMRASALPSCHSPLLPARCRRCAS